MPWRHLSLIYYGIGPLGQEKVSSVQSSIKIGLERRKQAFGMAWFRKYTQIFEGSTAMVSLMLIVLVSCEIV